MHNNNGNTHSLYELTKMGENHVNLNLNLLIDAEVIAWWIAINLCAKFEGFNEINWHFIGLAEPALEIDLKLILRW
jgi:hypothetical protein